MRQTNAYSYAEQISAHTLSLTTTSTHNRLMALTFHKDALRLKLRILAPDRPGIGGSTPQPNRTVRDYPGDVAQMCQLLHVDKFSMWGSSAGTMYALASTAAPETKDKVVPKVCTLSARVYHLGVQGTGAFHLFDFSLYRVA